MLVAYCPRHRARVLLSLSQICQLRNTSGGIDVVFDCTCGYRGTWHTGRVRPGRPAGDETFGLA